MVPFFQHEKRLLKRDKKRLFILKRDKRHLSNASFSRAERQAKILPETSIRCVYIYQYVPKYKKRFFQYYCKKCSYISGRNGVYIFFYIFSVESFGVPRGGG